MAKKRLSERVMEKMSKLPPEVRDFLKRYPKAVMAAQAGTFGETWSPDKPGDSITGTIADYRANQGRNEQDVISVETKKGLRSVWLGAVLAKQISKADVGKVVCLVYLGRGRQPKNRRHSPAKLYNVYKSK